LATPSQQQQHPAPPLGTHISATTSGATSWHPYHSNNIWRNLLAPTSQQQQHPVPPLGTTSWHQHLAPPIGTNIMATTSGATSWHQHHNNINIWRHLSTTTPGNHSLAPTSEQQLLHLSTTTPGDHSSAPMSQQKVLHLSTTTPGDHSLAQMSQQQLLYLCTTTAGDHSSAPMSQQQLKNNRSMPHPQHIATISLHKK